MTILQTLRKKYLQHELSKVEYKEKMMNVESPKGKKSEDYAREISEIQKEEDYAKSVKEKEKAAYREEELKQAPILGQERAKIITKKKIDQMHKTGGNTGFMAGLDKFLANTGVARGTAKVLGDSSGIRSTSSRRPVFTQPSFNVVTGFGGQRAPTARIPIRRHHHKKHHHKKRKVYYQQPSEPSYNIVTGAGRKSIF